MKTVMNITTCQEDTGRYQNSADLQAFYQSFGLDGLEVLEVGPDQRGVILPQDTIGVHLKYYSSWMDLWSNNQDRLLSEYQTPDAVRAAYGGTDQNALIQSYRNNIHFANTLQPEYLVFHVSECTMAESMLHQYYYTDEQVCDAAAALLNTVTDEIAGAPWLLLENLWYKGLTMEQPEIVQRLLDQIHYPKVGVMLDVGHLMHTNRDLENIDQAVDYIHSILDRYKNLDFVKGIHLHQSLTGAFAKACIAQWKPISGTYQEQMWDVMERIFRLDTHQPFCSRRIEEIFRRLPELEFLCLEQISSSREQHSQNLATQINFLHPEVPWN